VPLAEHHNESKFDPIEIDNRCVTDRKWRQNLYTAQALSMLLNKTKNVEIAYHSIPKANVFLATLAGKVTRPIILIFSPRPPPLSF